MPYTNIHILSFCDAAAYTCLRDIPPTIVISIDDKGFDPTPLDIDNPAIIGILKLWFGDVDEDWENTSTAISNENAEQIVAFVKRYLPLKPEILIHCAAGVSRSAGVAAALHRWLNGTDAPITDSPYRRPNFLCYKKVCAAAEVMIDECVERERFSKLQEASVEWDVRGYEDALMALPSGYKATPDYNDPEEVKANDKAWEKMCKRWKSEGYLFAQEPEPKSHGRRESFLGL